MSDFNAGVRAAAEFVRQMSSVRHYEDEDLGKTEARNLLDPRKVADRILALLRPEPAPHEFYGSERTGCRECGRSKADMIHNVELRPEPALSTTAENYGGSDSSHAPEPVAPPCWWIDHGSYGQITQRQDEAERAFSEGKRVVSYCDFVPVAPTCTAQTGPAAACVYREPLLRTAATEGHG